MNRTAIILAGLAAIGLGIARLTGPDHLMGVIFIALGSFIIGQQVGPLNKDPQP
ncbi:MAG TPA: hypothetical protein VFI23_03690 [Rhizomicrobium sp.]|nr:hypothetical protein [Rhizomicrobium sp.]